MTRLSAIAALLVLVVSTLTGCAQMSGAGGEWTTLIDGSTGLDNFNRTGDANWRAQDGAIVADQGKGGFLVTKNSYKDFRLKAEFWADHTTNSGIFIRAADPARVGADKSYEVNVFDQRPDQSYGTGAIVGFASVSPMPRAGGKWNTFEIVARGSQIQVFFNGAMTVDLRDGKFPQGPFALQFANGANNVPGGAIKWRKLQIRAL